MALEKQNRKDAQDFCCLWVFFLKDPQVLAFKKVSIQLLTNPLPSLKIHALAWEQSLDDVFTSFRVKTAIC